jgi:hypothetical protein
MRSRSSLGSSSRTRSRQLTRRSPTPGAKPPPARVKPQRPPRPARCRAAPAAPPPHERASTATICAIRIAASSSGAGAGAREACRRRRRTVSARSAARARARGRSTQPSSRSVAARSRGLSPCFASPHARRGARTRRGRRQRASHPPTRDAVHEHGRGRRQRASHPPTRDAAHEHGRGRRQRASHPPTRVARHEHGRGRRQRASHPPTRDAVHEHGRPRPRERTQCALTRADPPPMPADGAAGRRAARTGAAGRRPGNNTAGQRNALQSRASGKCNARSSSIAPLGSPVGPPDPELISAITTAMNAPIPRIKLISASTSTCGFSRRYRARSRMPPAILPPADAVVKRPARGRAGEARGARSTVAVRAAPPVHDCPSRTVQRPGARSTVAVRAAPRHERARGVRRRRPHPDRFEQEPAATYSPRPLRAKYHRR